MNDIQNLEIWFATGSQHLYGNETLKQVAKHSSEISDYIGQNLKVPLKIVHKEILTTPEEILNLCLEANHQKKCIGLITWMHTFSPAKMWIQGLKILHKPLLHFHTQYNSEIPWEDIDMDFMNLNQSAHGGREYGFMVSRLRKNRKIVVGHWQDKEVLQQLENWCRVAIGWNEFQHLKVARIGDNMREVAVTEGDKVEAQMRLGIKVNGYGVGDLVAFINSIPKEKQDELLEVYAESYEMTQEVHNSKALRDAATIELGLRSFLTEGGFAAFTNTFEDLHGMKQLPGIATQRLMADGYGYGGEGDWKTAALVRVLKAMSIGLKGGTSFMEDYTYDFRPGGQSRVLGAHMLEICPSIAASKPKCQVHPLSIGGKEDPARLVFHGNSGPAFNASLIDMGNRFRFLVNEVDTVVPDQDLPKLPVARVLWKPKPDLSVAATAWILAGGAHHTAYSDNLNTEMIEDLAEIAGMECVVIDDDTRLREFKQELRWSEVYYHLFNNQM